MPKIYLDVVNKIITAKQEFKLVNNNVDYEIEFSFDEEWDDRNEKTLRVEFEDNNYIDTQFTGDTVILPPIFNKKNFKLGVYSGEMFSTSVLVVYCKDSIVDGKGDEYILKPTGSIEITNTKEADVTHYAKAQVVDNNLVASNIKKDVNILGVEGSYEPELPTLFAPVITGGYNEISWINNESNGDFVVTITADVDGIAVISPLTITEQMDGKILTITASATNFTDAMTTIELAYLPPSASVYAAPVNNNGYFQIYGAWLRNENETVNSEYLFTLYNESSPTFTSTAVISVGSSSIDNQLMIVYRALDTEARYFRSGFAIKNDNYSGTLGERKITGTVVIENITTGNSKTWTFNGNSQVSQYGGGSFLHLNDIIKIMINITSFGEL